MSTEQPETPPNKPHARDEDCIVDPITDTCRICGAYHGEPCDVCSGKGFHRPDCPVSDANHDNLPLRVTYALREAEQAFWVTVSNHFREVETGDFPPDATQAFHDACTRAIDVWLTFNHPLRTRQSAEAGPGALTMGNPE